MIIQKFFSKVGKIVVLPLLLAVAAIGFCLVPAHAEDQPAYRLQISPTQAKIGTAQPGDTYTGSFEVQNTGRNAYKYTVDVTPFSVKGQNYEQDFETVSGYTAMTDWMELSESSTTVEPNSSATVNYTIKIPHNAPAGLQAVAIMVTMVNPDDMQTSGIQTVSRAAFPVYLNVDGETRREAEILSHKVPSFSFVPAIVTSSIVENDGNIYTNAEYWLEVRGFFNNQLEYSNTEYIDGVETPGLEVIFPDSKRYNEVSWDDAPSIGIFKVKSTVKIFDEVSTVEKTVIICPLWLIVVIVLLIGLMIFWIISRIVKRRN